MILDCELVRRRRIELRLSHRSVAAHIGVSPAAIRLIENGGNHNDLSLGTIAKLADILAVDIHLLFPRPETPSTSAPDDDPEVLGAALYASDTLTPTTAIAVALGWTVERVNVTADALAARLAAAGLRLHRVGGRLGIERAEGHLPTEQLTSIVRAHLLRAGLNLTEARLLRRIADGHRVKELSNPDAVAYGTLTNAGLVGADGRITIDVRYSLAMIDSRNAS